MSARLGRFEKAIIAGLHPNLAIDRPPLWRDGRNVSFKDLALQPIPGQTLIFDKLSAETPRGAIELSISGQPNLFWGTQTKLYRGVWKTPSPTDVSGAAYTGILDATDSQPATVWSFAEWGDLVFATNGVDAPQVWDLASPSAFAEWQELPAAASLYFGTAEIVLAYGAFIVVYNTGQGIEYASWSAFNSPFAFFPLAANEAGSLIFRDLGSEIRCVRRLGRVHAVYGTNQMRVLQFIGAPNFFGQEHLQDGIGAVSKNAVVSVLGVHYGFGPQGIWVTDGNTYQYIDDPSIRDFVFRNINRDQMSKVVGWEDKQETSVNWSFPQANAKEVSITISWNYQEKNWSIFEYARTAATSAEVFQNTMLFDASGNVYQNGERGDSPTTGAPLTLEALAEMDIGYGYGGYGFGGFGGHEEVVG